MIKFNIPANDPNQESSSLYDTVIPSSYPGSYSQDLNSYRSTREKLSLRFKEHIKLTQLQLATSNKGANQGYHSFGKP